MKIMLIEPNDDSRLLIWDLLLKSNQDNKVTFYTQYSTALIGAKILPPDMIICCGDLNQRPLSEFVRAYMASLGTPSGYEPIPACDRAYLVALDDDYSLNNHAICMEFGFDSYEVKTNVLNLTKVQKWLKQAEKNHSIQEPS